VTFELWLLQAIGHRRVRKPLRGSFESAGLLRRERSLDWSVLISDGETDRLPPTKGSRIFQQTTMNYIGSCLMCEDGKVRAMLRRARPISYRVARRAIGAEALNAWASSVHNADGGPNEPLDLKNAPAASFHRSRYDCLPCVYIIHKRIRHIVVGDRNR